MTTAREIALKAYLATGGWRDIDEGRDCDDGFDEAVQIITAAIESALLAERRRAIEWQDIASAPKNGTRVVLATWCDYNKLWLFKPDYWRAYHQMVGGEGWGWERMPTHWMPLPPRSLASPREETATESDNG